MKKRIKLFDPTTDINEEKVIKKILNSHFWASGAGTNQVLKFEEKFRDYIKTKKCVSVNSGTAALHLALSLFDIKNKEVIIPSISFVATAHAVIYNGGIPKFVDVDERNLCIDSEEISKNITNNTAIVLPVHFAGMPCELTKIKKIIKENNIKLIEDAAHATGSNYKNKKIGVHGDAVCFSFHPVKNLAMPTGGAITLNGKESKLQELDIKSKRWCGINNRKGTNYDVDRLGWNYYMNEFSAAIGLEQLKKIEFLNKKKKKIAKRYSDEIKIIEKIPFDENCSYHIYWIRVKNRNNFMKKMNERGIETGIHYNPIHKMTLYNKKINLPITERVSREVVSIPIHANLSDTEISKVIFNVNKFAENIR
jgi:perosamine synthetase